MRCSGTPHSKSFSGRRTAPEGGVSLEAKESSPPSTRALWLFNHFKLPPLGLWPWTKFWNLTNTQQESSGRREGGRREGVRPTGTELPSHRGVTSLSLFLLLMQMASQPGLGFSSVILPFLFQGEKNWCYQKRLAYASRAWLPILTTAAIRQESMRPGINEIWIMCLKAHMKGIY